MKVLMIHEITEDILKLDLSDFDILTFDDGLFSQYRYYKHFLKFNKPMYFFISTDIVCTDSKIQPINSIQCEIAHDEYFEYESRRYYMTWDQIKEIYNTDNCFIGGHSHTHPRLKEKTIHTQYNVVKDEVTKMMNSFIINDIKIDSFCYPYNEEIMFYKSLLNKFDIDKFFGKERIKVEDLILN
jgi:Polysaccharide deacetylase